MFVQSGLVEAKWDLFAMFDGEFDTTNTEIYERFAEWLDVELEDGELFVSKYWIDDGQATWDNMGDFLHYELGHKVAAELNEHCRTYELLGNCVLVYDKHEGWKTEEDIKDVELWFKLSPYMVVIKVEDGEIKFFDWK